MAELERRSTIPWNEEPNRALYNRLIYNNRLLQFRVLGSGLFEDGDVGVGVFPECEEILVGGQRPHSFRTEAARLLFSKPLSSGTD
jgi:hypothetical protein